MLLYTEESPTVLNTIHVASVQIIPVPRHEGGIDHFELHFMVGGGKIVHIVPKKYRKKLLECFGTTEKVKKLSRALLEVWMQIQANPSPQVAMTFDELIELVLNKC